MLFSTLNRADDRGPESQITRWTVRWGSSCSRGSRLNPLSRGLGSGMFHTDRFHFQGVRSPDPGNPSVLRRVQKLLAAADNIRDENILRLRFGTCLAVNRPASGD